MLTAAQPTCFLIADLSGYTGYLADVELDHAQDILADLIGAVVTALRLYFRLAKLEGDAPTSVPPQVAWEFLTKPGQRMSWQPWVTEVTVKGATGGRRGIGSSNHCMHGKDAVIEEILDWRPYDYVTDRTILETPGGPVRVLHTVEFEPVSTGTVIHILFGAPKTRREQALMKDIGPAYTGALQASFPGLIAQLEAELVARGADRDHEPQLPEPRPDGVLSGLGSS